MEEVWWEAAVAVEAVAVEAEPAPSPVLANAPASLPAYINGLGEPCSPQASLRPIYFTSTCHASDPVLTPVASTAPQAGIPIGDRGEGGSARARNAASY